MDKIGLTLICNSVGIDPVDGRNIQVDLYGLDPQEILDDREFQQQVNKYFDVESLIDYAGFSEDEIQEFAENYLKEN